MGGGTVGGGAGVGGGVGGGVGAGPQLLGQRPSTGSSYSVQQSIVQQPAHAKQFRSRSQHSALLHSAWLEQPLKVGGGDRPDSRRGSCTRGHLCTIGHRLGCICRGPCCIYCGGGRRRRRRRRPNVAGPTVGGRTADIAAVTSAASRHCRCHDRASRCWGATEATAGARGGASPPGMWQMVAGARLRCSSRNSSGTATSVPVRARIRMVGQTAQCVRAEVDPRPGAAQPHDRPKTPWEQSSRRAGRAWRALGGGRRALDGGRRAAWSVGCPRRWSRPGSAATVGAAWSASALCALHHASCPPRHPVWAPDLAPPLFPRARAPCAREERRRGLSNSTRWAMESTMQPNPPRRELAGRFQDLHRDLRGAGGRGRRGGGGVYAGAHRFNQGTTCFFFPPIPAPPQGSHWGS